MEQHKSYVYNPHFYLHKCEPAKKRETKKRLIQLSEMGLEEVGYAEFGVKGVMSGLYIERVWNMSDAQWDDYMKWTAGCINRKEAEKFFIESRMIIKSLDFKVKGTFESFYAAEHWLHENKYCYGSLCGNDPVIILKGNNYHYPQKWINVPEAGRKKIDGIITSTDFREGTVTIILYK